MKKLCVYILECADKSYYTGVTNNLERRLQEHQSGENKKSYTYTKRPVKLVWYSELLDANQAIDLEKQIKRWTRRKKEALINQAWDKLKLYALCKNNTSHIYFNSNHSKE